LTTLKNTLLLLLLALLILPALQKTTGLVKSKPLDGYFAAASKPAYSCSSWLQSTYQDQYRLYLEDSVGFKPDLVRLYNQIDFSLFSIAHASKIVAGKEGYLFSESYIHAWMGSDFVGRGYIEQKVSRARFLQEYLWEKHRILLLIVFAPGKGYFFPEFIPDRFKQIEARGTNYDAYVNACCAQGVNHIDFNRWLIQMKDTSRFMLYPKTGIHWSSYGAYLCADSLRRYLGARLKTPLPRMVLDSIVMDRKSRDDDNDIARTMNLIRDISHPEMAYPHFHFTGDSLQPKPRGLIVGDSFYWYWYYHGIIANTFSNTNFWYYNQDVYPEHFSTPTNTGSLDYPGTILAQDVIILLQTNGGYGDLGSGWIDRAWDYFYPGPSREKEIEAAMYANPEVLKTMEQKAKERGVTTDAMIRMDAIYTVNQALLKSQKNRDL
jgi:hypothetical protein